MRKLDFYSLPRSIQDRFIESSQAVAAPAALAVKPVSEKGSLLWAGGSLAVALCWAWFTSLGFGDLKSSLALGSVTTHLVHVVFAGLVVALGLRAYALSWAVGRLPYGSGQYWFPFGVVAAREEVLTAYDAVDLVSVSAKGSAAELSFKDGATFSFSFPDPEAAKAAVSSFEKSVEKWKDLAEDATLARARLNPLVESGVPNPLAPTDPHARPTLFPLPVLGGTVLILAAVLGLVVSFVRDDMSRKALYQVAAEMDTVEGYQAYLARGGEREEVAALLLPRAELKKAVAQGTVEAVEAFREKNPNLQIGGEVQNALREGLLKELEKAKAVGTLAALDALPKRYKAADLIAPEIALAKSAVYAKVMADFQAQASDKDADLIPFVQALLTYAQKHGPQVQLRFYHDFPQDPRMLDQIVSKSKKYYMGQKSLPSQYFLGKDARRREAALLERFKTRLQKAFPEDILKFELGPPLPKENAELPEITVPTLTLTHRERLSGGFVGGVPKAMYLGAAVMIAAEGAIPGSDKGMKFAWNAWRAPTFNVLSDEKKDMPDVYEEMMMGAFDKFGDIYLERWFGSQ